MTELRRGIGYVIQQIGLFPHQTIEENVGDRPAPARLADGAPQERAEELLALVGLDPARYARPLPGRSCRAASDSASAWPGRSRPTRR